ncbi:MAG TPA: hypothetical protein VLY45_04195 [Nitrospiria bacterium]|nr:hypothetical protein [Nitrospiria bacterium]
MRSPLAIMVVVLLVVSTLTACESYSQTDVSNMVKSATKKH